MTPYAKEHFKTVLLLQMSFELVQASHKISSQWSSQKYSFEVLKSGFPIFKDFVLKFHVHYHSVSGSQNRQLSRKTERS